jgi:hypothetical protein
MTHIEGAYQQEPLPEPHYAPVAQQPYPETRYQPDQPWLHLRDTRWISFVKVATWVVYGLFVLSALVLMIDGIASARGGGSVLMDVLGFIVTAVAGALGAAAIMIGLDMARDVSAIRAKLYTRQD